ncbi:hypothetical protein [Brasilonema sp. UFV-L1]|uniref:hypothetical protein n=1 Tax=Brasilonema sp. UFV-L1 TaxID=2234130 RepID=UPI00145C70C4
MHLLEQFKHALPKNGCVSVNYRYAWERGKFLLAFANSSLVAIVVTAFANYTSAVAVYALVRLKFRGRQVLLLCSVSTNSRNIKSVCIGIISPSSPRQSPLSGNPPAALAPLRPLLPRAVF